MLQLKTFTFNPLQVNAYLVYEPSGEGILIDPSCMRLSEFQELHDFIVLNDIHLAYQLNTHGHFDHVFGISMVRDAFHPKYLIHRGDISLLSMAAVQARSFGMEYSGPVPDPDGYVHDGDIITTETSRIQVLHVPGHSPGSVAFYETTEGWLFSGDTLFAGGIGRSDLPGGNYDQLMTSIGIKLLILPDATKVFPGHGPATDIKREKLTNPFLHGWHT